jgi:hypothetical protein
MKLDLYKTADTKKFYLKWIKNITVRASATDLLEENIGIVFMTLN